MISEDKGKRNLLIYLALSNYLMYFGYRIWEATFNNFAVEELQVGPATMGLIQAIREIPGLLGFVIGFLVLHISETRIMSLSIIILGIGLMLTGQSHTIPIVILSTIVLSIGFHFFMPSNGAVALMAVGTKNAPKRIGQLRSLGAFAALTATGFVFILANPWGYRQLFTIIGAAVIAAGVLLLFHRGSSDALPPGRKVVLRKRYWLFYTLAFLMGSRRHIFTTFAIFLLVREYGISVQTTAMLFLVNALINVYAMQRIGRLVGYLGERTMLTIAFTSLIFVFLGYAYVTHLGVLFGLFILDNLLFGFNIALPTYFQKIAVTSEEITANVSVQQTINHISAIIVPVVGGTIWELFGSQAPFLFGVAIIVISLVLTQFMRIPGSPQAE